MRIGQLNSQRRPLAVPVEADDGEQTLNIVYKPQSYTPALAARVRELVDNPLGAPEALALQLAAVLDSWDLQGDDGTPYPVSNDALAKLPTDFLSTVVNAIGEDASAVGKTTGATSDVT